MALCLQDNRIIEAYENWLRLYNVFRKDRPNVSYASGGVTIVTERLTACMERRLSTTLEGAAAQVLADRLITRSVIARSTTTYFKYTRAPMPYR